MAVELQQLLLALVLALAYFLPYAVLANREAGVGFTTGPRDCAPTGLSVTTMRLGRAYANHIETLPWFAIAVVCAHLAGKVDNFVLSAGWIYLGARLAYLPAYVFHVPYLRSAVWGAATLAIFAIVFRVLI